MANVARLTPELANADTYSIFDDFDWFVTAHRWTSVVADGGSIAVNNATGGTITLTNDTAADNDEIYVYSTSAPFLLAANKPFYGEGRIQFSESNTDDANVAFGFASSVGANLIVDDGAGMRTSGSILAIYKVDGGTAWKCLTRSNGVVYDNTSSKTAGGSSYQTLAIEVVETTSTYATVVFKCDGEFLKDATTGQVIRHNIAVASAAQMALFVGQKNGSANNEATTIDYLGASQAVR